MSPPQPDIGLHTPLTLRSSWRFPLQSPASRRDIITGGLWLMVPIIGWLMNMGHRIMVVHNLHHRRAPWPAWSDRKALLKHGCLTFAGMVWYGWPGVLLMMLGWWYQSPVTGGTGLLLWAGAVVAIPGYMTHYCKHFDTQEIFNPVRALSRVFQGGWPYWKAWLIIFPTMLTSLVGLLGLGVGFLFSSVWFWQVAAFCFASVFTQRFDLEQPTD